jgi:hypothetical protein
MAARTDRAAFRAWVRVNHPDAGGDPAEFAEGLRRLRREPVEVVRRRRWPVVGRVSRWRERRARARRLL